MNGQPSPSRSTLPSFEAFEAQALADGFDEVVAREWAPATVVEAHRHPFAVRALVVAGEMWLASDGVDERRLLPGDSFTLAAEALHAERYGARGACYWAARRKPQTGDAADNSSPN